MTAARTEVLLETGPRWVWASALDHPGWCRRGKGEEAAIEQLLAYADRYRGVVSDFTPGELHVVATLEGPPAMNDWAPSVPGPGEEAVPSPRELDALQRCWDAFDRITAASTATLTKGPRGGGRDRDGIVDHVREAERSYGRKIGVRVPPRTPWVEQRAALLEGFREPSGPWLPRYAVRRIAWHVLDHAWEVEDKQT
ncbi:MAG TPA: hypothetical protein VMZ11_02130 [Mycobacteriales bacterium]|nr:hypothetical protein [Mycobacteriales bacterium]